MTASIDDSQRLRALQSGQDEPPDVSAPHVLVQGVRIFALLTGLTGVGCLALAFGIQEWRVALAGSTLVVLAAIAGAVLVVNALVSDRVSYYQHGELVGWIRGWRGIPPDPDHPFMRN